MRFSGARAARVELKVALSEDRVVLYEETISVDRAVPGSGTKGRVEELVPAMAEALEAASELVAARVAAAVKSKPGPPP